MRSQLRQIYSANLLEHNLLDERDRVQGRAPSSLKSSAPNAIVVYERVPPRSLSNSVQNGTGLEDTRMLRSTKWPRQLQEFCVVFARLSGW